MIIPIQAFSPPPRKQQEMRNPHCQQHGGADYAELNCNAKIWLCGFAESADDAPVSPDRRLAELLGIEPVP